MSSEAVFLAAQFFASVFSKNTNNSKNDLLVLPDKKDNLKKNYRYDVLSYNFFYYEDKNDEFSYAYNYNINKDELIDMWCFYIDVLDKKTRLCNDKTKKEYLQKTHDPLLNGSYRGIIKKMFSPETTLNINVIY